MKVWNKHRTPLIKGICFICFGLFLALTISACAGLSDTRPEEVRKKLVWPTSPEDPRITFVREIRFPRDISRNSGIWNWIQELLVGKDRSTLVRPYGVTVDQDDNLLIADPGAQRIHVYHLPDGKYRQLPHKKDDLALLSPIDLDVDDNGRIFVSDSAAKKVYVFDKQGRMERTLGEYRRPTGLAVNRALARVYVVDTTGHRVRVYETNGEFLFDIGQRGLGKAEFNFPTNICLDRAGNIYVTDSMNFRIQAFDQDGHFLYNFGQAGDGPGGFSKPRGVAVDSDGHIYVADAIFDNVQIFDPTGKVLLYFGTPGRQPGEFYLPAGLVIDSRDRIFVVDSFNQRIQVFQYLKER